MKKALIGLTLLTVLATTLAACGGDTNTTPTGGTSPAGGAAKSPASGGTMSPAASPSPKKS